VDKVTLLDKVAPDEAVTDMAAFWRKSTNDLKAASFTAAGYVVLNSQVPL
jgi:hypothetical protein